MKKYRILLLVSALFFIRGFLHSARIEVHFNLRLYQAVPSEGAAVFIRWKTAKAEAGRAAYFYTGSAEGTAARPEEGEIKKVFKVRELQIVSENAIKIAFDPDRIRDKSRMYIIGYWDGHYGIRGPLLETTLSDGQRYALRIIPIDIHTLGARRDARRFKLQIYEPPLRIVDKDSASSQTPSNYYVDVDFSLPVGHTTIIGFADSKDTPYFLSIKMETLSGVFEKLVLDPQSGLSHLPETTAESTVLQPEIVNKSEPVYPKTCRDKGIEGTVELEVAVDVEGRPARVTVLRGVHPELDGAAVEAIEKWIFKPYLVEGRPKPAVYVLTVDFRLNNHP